MSQIVNLLYYACFIVFIVLTLFVFLKNFKSTLNQYFSLFSLSLLGWLVTLYLFNRETDQNVLTLLGRSNFAAVGLAVFFGFLFVKEIIKKPSQYKAILFIETFILCSITQFTNLIDKSEHFINEVRITEFGILFDLYVLHLVGYIASALYSAFKSKVVNARTKRQLLIIGIGIFLTTAIALTTNVVLPYIFNNFTFQELGALSVLFLLLSVAYSITFQQLFDVRLVIRRTVVFTLLLGIIFTIYGGFIFILAQILQTGSIITSKQSFVGNFLGITLIGFSFDPLRRWLQNTTDHFLFKKEYEQQAVLKELTGNLNNVIGLDEALETVMQSIVKALHLQHAATFVFQPGENGSPAIKRIKQIGYHSSTHIFLEEKDFVINYFSRHPNLLLTANFEEELKQEKSQFNRKTPSGSKPSQAIRDYATKQAVLKKLHDLEVAVAMPLHINQQLIGLVLLSDKMAQDSFTREDLTLIELIGGQAVSSIQKAKLFEGDQMKSEFVSIASHELLTPISAIEGYLSMILDENLGHVDKQAKEYLTKVYTSAQRLSVLIKDLLSVSRIEAGRLKIEPQSLDLEKLIKDTIDQLKFVAEDKKIALNYQKPEKSLPSVWADPDRTMQILINLVSNAIKYTTKGSVTIRVDHHNQLVFVEVEDTGIGMTRQEQSHLFEKFYRVASPQTTGIIGTGLGLYITKSILEKMGGSISLKSAPGKGSCFTFTLPTFKVELSSLK